MTAETENFDWVTASHEECVARLKQQLSPEVQEKRRAESLAARQQAEAEGKAAAEAWLAEEAAFQASDDAKLLKELREKYPQFYIERWNRVPR